ncbi:hypothetical protein AKJ09_05630 [Labilithrix luteola]|uniref:Cell surface protein n=1 Tax=Labilithrix luteola TaxID=1391654 RepID=A0A0K1PZZ9_9BACT|nr:hypothetical protein [Labilithrix luteola]AKU98966.1 hypothetical protein AKJ09_05630 [Labilithrix luteola]
MRIRRALALLSFLGLAACESGGTHATLNGSNGSGSAASESAHLKYIITTDASYTELSRFGDNVIANARTADGNLIAVVDQNGNDIETRPVDNLHALTADPVAGTVAFVSGHGINFLESVSGTGWSVPLPDSVALSAIAVHDGDVVIAASADTPTTIGCTSNARGLVLARYRDGRCVGIWAPFGLAQSVDPKHTDVFIRRMKFGPDGSLALAGVFGPSMKVGDQAFNSAGGDDMFVTVLEPGGMPRFTRVAGNSSGETISSLSWNPEGTKLYLSGQSTSDLDFGDGERRNGTGSAFLSSFDATTGAHLWSVSPSTVSDSAILVGGVDEGRVMISMSHCYSHNDGTVVLPSDASNGYATCIGAFDANSGDRLYMMQLGPELSNTETLAGPDGFWLSTSFKGRPDFGNGKVSGGHDVFARYVFR